jgi:hypothetical protein
MFKAYKYATNDERVSIGLKHVNVKGDMQFTKDNHMDKTMKKRKTWMGKGMCWKGVVTLKT